MLINVSGGYHRACVVFLVRRSTDCWTDCRNGPYWICEADFLLEGQQASARDHPIMVPFEVDVSSLVWFEILQWRSLSKTDLQGARLPIVASNFSKILIYSNSQLPRFWNRYVGDAIIRKNKVESTLDFRNALHPSIEYILEVEKGDQFSFWDLLLRRKQKLYPESYRKPTDT